MLRVLTPRAPQKVTKGSNGYTTANTLSNTHAPHTSQMLYGTNSIINANNAVVYENVARARLALSPAVAEHDAAPDTEDADRDNEPPRAAWIVGMYLWCMIYALDKIATM
jgi:hypothetical protein